MMIKKMNKLLVNPPGITPDQEKNNDREWNNPANWSGFLFPSYSSELDSRPFVPARMFRPKFENDNKWAQVLCTHTSNRRHARGRIWTKLAWITVLAVCAGWLILLFRLLLNE
jgi:hypothetical protein